MPELSDSQTGTVVFLSGDLMFASRVRGAAQNAGLGFHLGGALPADIDPPIKFVILDLATRSSLTETLMAECLERCPHAKVIAYGPHVQVSKLAAAKEAGFPVVITRGQFDTRLPGLFAE